MHSGHMSSGLSDSSGLFHMMGFNDVCPSASSVTHRYLSVLPCVLHGGCGQSALTTPHTRS